MNSRHCKSLAGRILLLVAILASPAALLAEGWETSRFGRPGPGKLNWSLKPAVVAAFSPSGIGSRIVRCGEFTILHNHGLYWANEENPDVSKDMQASVLLFRGNHRVFAARGYKFSGYKYDAGKNTIVFSHWTGAMGDDQIEEITLDLAGGPIKCTTRLLPADRKNLDLRLFARRTTANKTQK